MQRQKKGSRNLEFVLTDILEDAVGVTVMSLIGNQISSVPKLPLRFWSNSFGSRKHVTDPILRLVSLVVSFIMSSLTGGASLSVEACFSFRRSILLLRRICWMRSLMDDRDFVSRFIFVVRKYFGCSYIQELTPAGNSKRANTVRTRKFPLNNFSGRVNGMLELATSDVCFVLDLNDDLKI